MPLSIARQTNRSRVLFVSIFTRGYYINTVQLNYFACRNFIFHITSPYTNKSITDCIFIIYDFKCFVNRFNKKFYNFLFILFSYALEIVFLALFDLFRLLNRRLSFWSWAFSLRFSSYRSTNKTFLKFRKANLACLFKSSFSTPGFVEIAI